MVYAPDHNQMRLTTTQLVCHLTINKDDSKHTTCMYIIHLPQIHVGLFHVIQIIIKPGTMDNAIPLGLWASTFSSKTLGIFVFFQVPFPLNGAFTWPYQLSQNQQD